MKVNLGSLAIICLSLASLDLTAFEPATPQISREEIVSLVSAMLKSWEIDDEKTFLDSFADNSVFAYPGGRLTKNKLQPLFEQYHHDKKNIKIYIGDFVVQGNIFAAQYQFAATDIKSGQRQAVGTGITGTVVNGKLHIYKEYWDEHIPEFQKSGKIPLDEGQFGPAPASVVMTPERVN